MLPILWYSPCYLYLWGKYVEATSFTSSTFVNRLFFATKTKNTTQKEPKDQNNYVSTPS